MTILPFTIHQQFHLMSSSQKDILTFTIHTQVHLMSSGNKDILTFTIHIEVPPMSSSSVPTQQIANTISGIYKGGFLNPTYEASSLESLKWTAHEGSITLIFLPRQPHIHRVNCLYVV